MLFRIETKRLIIRDIQKKDFSTLLKFKIEHFVRPNILYQKSDFVYDEEELNNSISSAKHFLRQDYKLAVILKSENILIGTCSIYNVAIDSIAFIGWHFQNKFSGNGYATETAQELLYLGFEMSRVAIIYADAFTDNIASIRVMEKIGMSPDWTLNSYSAINGNGESKSVVRHLIFRKEWLTLNS